jgi:hypothetical protein
MKFTLRKRLNDDTDYYDLDSVVKYSHYLEEQGRLVQVGNLRFDAQEMMRPFVCDTCLCIPPKGNNNGRAKPPATGPRKNCSCCVVYTPRLSTQERERIEKILPGLRRRFPNLGKAIDRKDGFYEWDETYDRLVHKYGKDLCIFQTPDTSEFGFHACMIHAYCRENRLSETFYKPSACVMFPLYLLDLGEDNGGLLITAHTHEVCVIGEDDDDYVEPGCLKKNPLAKRPLYIEMKNTLVHMFGLKAWSILDRELRKRQSQPSSDHKTGSRRKPK